MPQASRKDRDTVVSILSQSFRSNPSVLATVKKDSPKKRINALAEYVFDTGIQRKGVYLSSDRKGAAICYHYNFKKEGFQDYLNQFKLVVNAIGLTRVFEILRREGYIKSKRPKDGNFLYFWFFGVADDALGSRSAFELKDEIFKEAAGKGLPIYLETSVEKNKRVYERFGFEVYHIWEKEPETPLYFMRKQVD